MRKFFLLVLFLLAVVKIYAQKIDTDGYEHKFKLYAFLALLFLIASILLILYFSYRRNNNILKQVNKQRDLARKTLQELKNTQEQLIVSEKMASLGELTAGIAHEIQNPLNFINNFSEINMELIEEVKAELKSGNLNSGIELISDIKQNLEKISYHGKRAESIVKNMLLQSRKGNGQKELTSINDLVDECLRLSYHGLRAKDKSFNASLKCEFDSEAGQINIIIQDISRVLLNLFNNAFYSVHQKAISQAANYQPIVTVSTKKKGDYINICIHDNGLGIPADVINKIYQPFFTTKPTGEGTGLGLSMSYDIITKGHNGKIEVKSSEGVFAEFDILLPC